MAFLSGGSLVEKTDGEMARLTGCLSAESLADKLGDLKVVMMDCSMALDFDDLMVRVLGCLSAVSIKLDWTLTDVVTAS